MSAKKKGQMFIVRVMVIAFPDFDFVSLREPVFDSLRLDRYRAELGIVELCGDIQPPFQKFAALAEARRVTPHRDCDPIKFDSYVHALASLLLLTSGSGRSRANKSAPPKSSSARHASVTRP